MKPTWPKVVKVNHRRAVLTRSNGKRQTRLNQFTVADAERLAHHTHVTVYRLPQGYYVFLGKRG